MRWRDRAASLLVPSFGTLALTVTKNTSVSLGDHFAEFIQEQVARGRFSSASDVVRAGLRLLEEREARLLALQAALVEGERSGEPEPFDFDDFLKDKRHAATRGR
jgi:antitoxin ParD1/3/4